MYALKGGSTNIGTPRAWRRNPALKHRWYQRFGFFSIYRWWEWPGEEYGKHVSVYTYLFVPRPLKFQTFDFRVKLGSHSALVLFIPFILDFRFEVDLKYDPNERYG